MEAARDQGRGEGGARVASWLAWSVCAVTLLVLTLAMLPIVLGWSTPLPRGWTPWRDQTVSLLGIIGAPFSAASSPHASPATPTDGCGSASGWASPFSRWQCLMKLTR